MLLCLFDLMNTNPQNMKKENVITTGILVMVSQLNEKTY